MTAQELGIDLRGARCLVTGGSGFLGRHLTRYLVERGAIVWSLARHPSPGFSSDRLNLIEGDVRDAGASAALTPACDAVFHLAGFSGAASSFAAPQADVTANVLGTLNVLSALEKDEGVPSVVLASSRLVYGHPRRLPVSERAMLAPRSPYAVSKLAAEKFVDLYTRTSRVRGTSLRVTNPYGPGQPRGRTAYGVVNHWIQLAIDDEAIPIYGAGNQLRDYVYVEDVCRAFTLAAFSPRAAGRVFNVGSGEGTPMCAVALDIVKAAGRGRTQQVQWPSDALSVETGSFIADVRSIARHLGWKASTAWRDGLERTVRMERSLRLSSRLPGAV